MIGFRTRYPEPKTRPAQRFPLRELDDDAGSVKDVFDCVVLATSKFVRDAFETFGWAVKDFSKTPGRNFHNLNVHRTDATRPADLRQARQAVADILETVGLWTHGDDLLVYQAGDRLGIGLVAALEDDQRLTEHFVEILHGADVEVTPGDVVVYLDERHPDRWWLGFGAVLH